MSIYSVDFDTDAVAGIDSVADSFVDIGEEVVVSLQPFQLSMLIVFLEYRIYHNRLLLVFAEILLNHTNFFTAHLRTDPFIVYFFPYCLQYCTTVDACKTLIAILYNF